MGIEAYFLGCVVFVGLVGFSCLFVWVLFGCCWFLFVFCLMALPLAIPVQTTLMVGVYWAAVLCSVIPGIVDCSFLLHG